MHHIRFFVAGIKDCTFLEAVNKFLIKLYCIRAMKFPKRIAVTNSDFEKHLTIENCDKIFLKIILRLKSC